MAEGSGYCIDLSTYRSFVFAKSLYLSPSSLYQLLWSFVGFLLVLLYTQYGM
jgi:hypothetical protein